MSERSRRRQAAALRTLAEHPNTPPAEAEAARRKADELEATLTLRVVRLGDEGVRHPPFKGDKADLDRLVRKMTAKPRRRP